MDQLVSLPRLDITIDGVPLSVRAGNLLSEVRVQQRLSLPTMCEILFIDPLGLLVQESAVVPGSELQIRMTGKPDSLFTGQVTAVEYVCTAERQRLIRVRGYDRLHQLRKRQPVRAHVEVTLQDLAQVLCADIGVNVVIDEPGPVWRRIVQYRQSDLELLTDTADRCGQYFFLRDGAVNFYTLSGSGTAQALQWGSNLLEASVIANGEPACRSVQLTGWDPWRAEQHTGSASEPRTGRQIQQEVPPDLFDASGERTIVDRAVQDGQQADVIAQAELDRRVAGEVVFSGVAMGDVQLQPGRPVEVSGLNNNIDGQYILTGVTHVIDHHRGYIALLDSAPPTRTATTRHEGMSTIGIVTRVDDPDGLGRMRVVLPNFNNIETDWLSTVLPAAGKDKGVVALNNIDDRVLVHFIDQDPAQAVILGGMYGEHPPPDAGVVDGETRRYLIQLPGGQQLLLDDDKNVASLTNGKGSKLRLSPGHIKITNSDGSCLEMSRDKVSILSNVPLDIAAPGQPVTIRGQSIDFERAS